MFIFKADVFNYTDPWHGLLFVDRLKLLVPTTKRIAYFYENPDNSTFRYRVYNMLNVINTSVEGYSASFFHNGDLDYIDDIVKNCEILVLCRVKYSDKINRLITVAKSKGVKIVFDVDDLIFNVEYTHLILNTLDQTLTTDEAWNHWFGMIGRIGQVLKMCDSAVSTNRYLAAEIEKFASVPCSIIPNFLNPEQMQLSEQIMQQKRSSDFARDKKINLGYFSGTPTHNLDFDLISNALIQVFKQDKRIQLNIVGYMELKNGLKPYLDRIKFYPFQDYVNLQRLMAEVEVNLIPLQNNIFTNCKSELKYFDAAIGGTLSVASPTNVYTDAIQDGANGFLASDMDWDEKILQLIDSFPNYAKIAESAYQNSVDNYAWYNQSKKISAWLSSLQLDISRPM